MGDWKSDDEVRSAADRAARRLIDLFNHEQPDGKWLGSPEAYLNPDNPIREAARWIAETGFSR
jgi:hypothetical protein